MVRALAFGLLALTHFTVGCDCAGRPATAFVTIETPSENTAISQANVGALAVSGTCSDHGQPVELRVGELQLAAPLCDAGQWSVTADLTTAPEGTLTLTADHARAAGTAAPQARRTIVKDTIAPSVASLQITNASPLTTTALTLSWGPTNDSFTSVCLLENSSDRAACTWVETSTLPAEFTCTATAGAKTLTAWLRDSVGNVSPAVHSNEVTLVTLTPPVVMLTNLRGGEQFLGGSTQSITWSTTTSGLPAMPIRLDYSLDSGLTWQPIAGALADTGTATWVTPATDSAHLRVRVTVTDSHGLSGSDASSSDLVIDTTPPLFTSGAMRINAGAATTGTTFVTVDFTATDSAAPVSAWCLTGSTVAPSTTDSCWVSVTPAASISPVGNFRIGFVPGPYSVWAWARNTLGLTSALTAAGAGTQGIDLASITYAPLPPPTLSGVTASSSDATVNLSVAQSGTVFIKWAATSTAGLRAQPISLFVTSDDVTFAPIASAVANGAGNGCTVSGAQTGCFTWVNGAPSSGYFRVRVGATDVSGRTSFQTSLPMNVGATLRILAGTTDPGTGGSAEAALFSPPKPASGWGDPKALIVSTAGDVYFNDGVRGLLRVLPGDGLQRVLAVKTGVTAIDGLAPGPATTRDLKALAFDAQGRVLLFDFDRIRRFDPTSGQLSTIIGGGSQNGTSVPALSLAINPIQSSEEHTALLVGTPDGKIYFQSDSYSNTQLSNGFQVRVYDPATGLVTIIQLSGMGDSASSSVSLTTTVGVALGAAFDRVTGRVQAFAVGENHFGTSTFAMAITDASGASTAPHPNGFGFNSMLNTGADGVMYAVTRSAPRVLRLDALTHTFTPVLGTGTSGQCADGTPALSCAIDPSDVTADATGHIYFLERGRVRTIDPAGAIRTVMGASGSLGDGTLATEARAGTINDVKLWSNSGVDTVVFSDGSEYRLREFAIGGVISTIAGTGGTGLADAINPAAGQPLDYANQGGVNAASMQVDPTTGFIFTSARNHTALSVLNRSTGRWSDIVGGGATGYWLAAADGRTGAQIDFQGYAAQMLGLRGTQLLVQKFRFFSGNASESVLKTYDTVTGTQGPMIGQAGAAAIDFGVNGTTGSACVAPYPYVDFANGTWDSFGNRWVVAAPDDVQHLRTLTTGGTIGSLPSLGAPARTFAYRHDATHNIVYFCHRNTGALGKTDLGTMSTAVLSLAPLNRMRCSGISLIYSASRNSLIFGFQQDGSGGIAEYLNP